MNKLSTKGLIFLSILMLQFNTIGQQLTKYPGSPNQTISYATTVDANGIKRCGTMEADSLLRAANPGMPTLYQDEMWLQQKIQEFKAQQSLNGAAKATLLTIPVVIHVIHNGDAVGSNENIADAQVISQIQVLNEDFRRILGTPGYNTNPDGADIEVEFCLAVIDETGNPHSGIDRVNYGQAAFTGQADANTMKAATYWNPDDYMNMWTVNYGNSGLLGFAQFPNTSGLAGLNNNNGGATTDGVVADYRSFGSSAIYPAGTYSAPYDLGRTMTHEVGHYLGLRHIWGDANCGDDFCADTPESTTSNGGCPTQTTCDGNQDMVENYMDYTNDACMNIFTDDQKTRIRTVFTVSPRRLSLTTSTKCVPANPDDIGVFAVNSPTGSYCASSFIPNVDVKNYGNNNVTSFTLFYDIDGAGTQSFLWTGTLTPSQTVNIVLPTMSPTAGPHVFNAYTDIPNGNVDPYTANDANLSNFTMIIGGQLITLDLEVDCFGDEITWEVQDAGSSVIYSGGPYSVVQNGEDVIVNMCLSTGCYDFIIDDSFGDGMAGDGVSGCVGDGTYSIYDAGATVLATIQNVDFGNQEINNFCVTSACDDPDVPTLTASPTTVCDGNTSTISIAGNLDDATDWYVYTGSCGGTVVGTTSTTTIDVTPAGPTTTYFIRGEGGCVVPGVCGSVTITVDPIEDATFAYGAASYCVDASDPTPTVSGVGSGTYSSVPAGLSINGSTGAIDVSASTPNTYTITYTTPGTCTGSSDEVVTINALPAAPTVLTSGSTAFCAGGSVDLTSSQASGNVWSNTATTQTINVTGAGTYSVTYTDGNGCSATSANTAVTVNTLPAAPTISADGPTSFCTGGSVNLTSSQASGNVWSNTATTQTINVSGTGNFSVTYTDGNGCSSTSATTAVTLNANPSVPTISAGGPTTFCAGGSVNLTSSQASGNVWSTTETTQTINATGTGNYSVTYTDGNGCSATSAMTAVTVNTNPAAPTISAGGPTTFCAGGTVTLTSSQGSGNVWSTASTSNNIIVSTGGPYSVTYTDVNGCSATSGVTNVTVNPAPVIAVGTVLDPNTCATATGSIQITGSGTGVVSWAGSASGTSGSVSLPFTITGLAAGSYNVTFDDGCGSNMLNQTLTDPTPPTAPTITAGGPTTFCAGGSVTLTSSYGTGNTWSTAETTGAINVNATGTYSVTYTDGSGCSSSSAPINVTVNASPAIPTVSPDGPTTFCSGGSVNLSSSQATGNVWSTAATTQVINVTTAGPYSVTYTDGNGCSSTSAATTITVNATPSAPVISASGPLTFCAGGSVDLTSSQASGNVWSTTETTQMISANATGAYSVVYTAANGCSATSAVTNVTVNPIPVISIGGITNPSACATATGSIQVSGTGTGVVSWTGTASGTSGSVTLPYTIPNLGAGPYNVTFEQSGCTSAAIAPTLVDPTPPAVPNVVASGATTFCTGGSVDLTSSYASGNVWSNTGTTQSITVNTSGVYTVTYTDGSGCSSTSAPISITVNANPVAPIVTANGPITFCDGGSVDLTSDQSTGIVWSSTETTATISVAASGTFDVTYTDGNGCFATSTQIIVTVNPIPSAPIITANGPTTFCDGGSVDLSSDQTTGNDWSTTETTQTITVSAAGSYSVTYIDGNGCSAISSQVDVVVNALPIVTFGALSDVCDYSAAFSLTGASPAGGSYSGTGVTGGSFDPSVAGVGTHTITYDYTDGNGCAGSAQQDINVGECLDLHEITSADIVVYPNPTSTLVNVYAQGALINTVKVYDGAGRLISEYNKTAEKIAVDLSQFTRGVYHLEIALGDQIYRSRVVKK
ncbi:MAG: hypothetical protein ACJA1C_001073 [Crocinitomicaceae bacterium]|jgi:hypothetical protein